MPQDPHRQPLRRRAPRAGIGLVRPARGLHICPECRSHLVAPLRWTDAGAGFCELTLHCPNCDWLTDGVFGQDDVDALEDRLDEGVTAILSDLRRLTHSNMLEELERFAAALDAGLILPEDF